MLAFIHFPILSLMPRSARIPLPFRAGDGLNHAWCRGPCVRHRLPPFISPFHPECLGQLEFPFPHEPRWLESHKVQRPMCQTSKTLIHACNQIRSRLLLDQQQRQPNTTTCTSSARLLRPTQSNHPGSRPAPQPTTP
jgi:hypothetical protein